jgi:hypothetical protein
VIRKAVDLNETGSCAYREEFQSVRRHDAVVVVRRQKHGGRVLAAAVVAGGALLPRPPHVVQRRVPAFVVERLIRAEKSQRLLFRQFSSILDQPLEFLLLLRAAEIASPCTTCIQVHNMRNLHSATNKT